MQEKPIFSDTDCLSCFIMIDRTDILQELYEYITIPEYVYNEFLKAPKDILERVEYMMEIGFLKVKDIETDEEYKVYLKFKRNIYTKKPIGNGEASAMALAKIYDGIIASNNSKDVILTVQVEDIPWIKTGDILEEAIDSKIITLKDGNKIWKEMLNKGRYLGKYKTLTEYLENKYKNFRRY